MLTKINIDYLFSINYRFQQVYIMLHPKMIFYRLEVAAQNLRSIQKYFVTLNRTRQIFFASNTFKLHF